MPENCHKGSFLMGTIIWISHGQNHMDIQHALTDDQKRVSVRVQTAKRLLKMLPKFNQ